MSAEYGTVRSVKELCKGKQCVLLLLSFVLSPFFFSFFICFDFIPVLYLAFFFVVFFFSFLPFYGKSCR